MVKSAIFQDPQNYAIIEFTRPFITSQIKTINYIGTFSYNVYLSWGIFENDNDWNLYKIKGDVKLNTFKTPQEKRFMINYPDPPDQCFIFARYLGASLTLLGLTIMITLF